MSDKTGTKTLIRQPTRRLQMDPQIKLIDVSGALAREQAFWPTVVLPRAAIDAEIERLASLPRPAN